MGEGVKIHSLFLALQLGAASAYAADLYLLSATPTFKRAATHAARLLRVPAGSGSSEVVSEVLPRDRGVAEVFCDLVRRRLVATSFLAPSVAVVVDMDAPSKAKVLTLNKPEFTLGVTHLIHHPEFGLGLAGDRFGGTETPQRPGFVVARLDASLEAERSGNNAVAKLANPADLRFAQLSGSSGVAGLGGRADTIIVKGTRRDGLTRLIDQHGSFDVAVPLPPIAEWPGEDEIHLLVSVKNKDLIVLSELRETGDQRRWKRDPGFLWIYQAAEKKWSKAPVQGEVEVRPFGRWLVTPFKSKDVAAAGGPAAFKARLAASKPHRAGERLTGPDKGRVFADRLWYATERGTAENYEGRFRIFDAAEPDKGWELNAGHEDSEVLLVEWPKVMYRVSGSIWQVEITREGGFLKPKLIASGADFEDVHWAFFSPKEP